mgnify:FL=1
MAGGRSLVRLDPVHRGERIEVWQARAYSVPVDPLLPLEQMTEPYTAVATITIDAGTAYVQGMHGEMSRAIMRSFRARLRAIGVSRIRWQRQRERGVKQVEQEA